MSNSKNDTLKYMSGFGSSFESEALENVLPKGQNNPQKCAYGLYAEQLSGTAFTAPRLKNQRSWLYRIRPSVHTSVMKPYDKCKGLINPDAMKSDPNQLRWNPFDPKNSPFVSNNSSNGGSNISSISSCIRSSSTSSSSSSSSINSSILFFL